MSHRVLGSGGVGSGGSDCISNRREGLVVFGGEEWVEAKKIRSSEASL